MAKSKALIAAETRIAELEASIVAQAAQLELARTCWRNQRAQIKELEAQLAARGRFAQQPKTRDDGVAVYYHGARTIKRYPAPSEAHAQ